MVSATENALINKYTMDGSLSPTSVARVAELWAASAAAMSAGLAGSALANSQIADPRLALEDRQRIGRLTFAGFAEQRVFRTPLS